MDREKLMILVIVSSRAILQFLSSVVGICQDRKMYQVNEIRGRID